jgi:hypothetical protein
VPAILDAQHESQLTRPDVTAAVHYLHFALTADQVDDFAGSVQLVIDHPAYTEAVSLLPATIAELRTDLLPDPAS